MLSEAAVKVLKDNIWDLATVCEKGYPNVIPVAFKDVTSDGKLVVADVFFESTMKNVQNNGKIAVSAYNAATMEGYQIKGSAEYLTEGEIVDTFKKIVEAQFGGAMTAKGALVITPKKVIVTTPGPENKKEL